MQQHQQKKTDKFKGNLREAVECFHWPLKLYKMRQKCNYIIVSFEWHTLKGKSVARHVAYTKTYMVENI